MNKYYLYIKPVTCQAVPALVFDQQPLPLCNDVDAKIVAPSRAVDPVATKLPARSQ
jgi:hypothetical protein